MKFRVYFGAMILAAAVSTGTVFAEEEFPTLPMEAVDALEEFTTRLLDPPLFRLDATLQPPKTNYEIVNVRGLEEYSIRDVPGEKYALGSQMVVGDERWEHELSCGEWSPGGDDADWFHPSGQPPACTHEESNKHKGTIRVSFLVNVAAQVVWEDIGGEDIFFAKWLYQCTIRGALDGSAICKGTQIAWGGREGSVSSSGADSDRGLIYGGGFTLLVLAAMGATSIAFQRLRKRTAGHSAAERETE